jgi:hypothetical protein
MNRASTIFELFSGKDKALLVGGDSLFILDFRLHIVDRVRGLDLKGNSLTRQGFDEDLHCQLAHNRMSGGSQGRWGWGTLLLTATSGECGDRERVDD